MATGSQYNMYILNGYNKITDLLVDVNKTIFPHTRKVYVPTRAMLSNLSI